MKCFFWLAWAGVCLASVCPGGETVSTDPPPPQTPLVAPASSEAEQGLAFFQLPQSLTASVFAAEPLVANPVAFCLDNQGRVYVCETFRQNRGVEDNRSHPEWLDEDLAAQTVADRIAYIRKHLGERAVEYTRHDDRIRLLTDADGDHRADESIVFADRFNGLEEGTGAGVLAYKGNVYYTCIPKLWLLRDTDQDGQAEVRRALHGGYGVRFAFRGHDLHGLCIGPDGRLYFSIGDRGLNVLAHDDGRLINTESGAVLRCELDGSNLEIFATGLRNPQELAFDDHGSLFTGDNNSDSGDKARWVYVVEGGDSGWRMAYQYLSDRGPFNREKLWHPYHPGQAAYIVPPVANIADGPSGLAYYPGTGLSDKWKEHFFLCDFRGTPTQSGIRAFRVEPKGAFFELVDPKQFIWNILATDVDFGPEGAVYISDWVNGWEGLGKGRIYRFANPSQAHSAVVQQVRDLLATGVKERSASELVNLLRHVDRRVRMLAQFELATRQAVETLHEVALHDDHQLARLHALWALGQIARHSGDPAPVAQLVDLLEDAEAQVRAHVAKLLGAVKADQSFERLIEALDDESPRVQGFAALSLGKLGRLEAVGPLLALLEKNADQDPVVRHFCVMGLTGTGSARALLEEADRASRSARLGIVLALRRLASPTVAEFLYDEDPLVALEAARAIHDAPIVAAMPQLATALDRKDAPAPFQRRALNANFRLGGDRAAAIAVFATRADAPLELREEALDMLADWGNPSSRDRVLGMWRPLAGRSPKPAQQAIRRSIGTLLEAVEPIQVKAAQVAASYKIPQAGVVLRRLVLDDSVADQRRADMAQALASLGRAAAFDTLQACLKDESDLVRAKALGGLAQISSEAALPALRDAVQSGATIERQLAFAALGEMKSAQAAEILSSALDELLADRLPAAVHHDLLESAQGKPAPNIPAKLQRYRDSFPADDPLAEYWPALEGGDPQRGQAVFFARADASCVRCHKIEDQGGEVGPDLTKIPPDKTRQYLLEAIVTPNRAIAKGFETTLIATIHGRIYAGIVKEETEDRLRLMAADGQIININQDEIEERQNVVIDRRACFPSPLRTYPGKQPHVGHPQDCCRRLACCAVGRVRWLHPADAAHSSFATHSVAIDRKAGQFEMAVTHNGLAVCRGL